MKQVRDKLIEYRDKELKLMTSIQALNIAKEVVALHDSRVHGIIINRVLELEMELRQVKDNRMRAEIILTNKSI